MAIPIANAGADQLFAYSAAPFNVALADGGSTDPDPGENIVGWAWTLEYMPPGSAASLSGATTSTPQLNNVDIEGTYRIFLVVTNDAGVPETSETDKTLAPDSAFVQIVHKTENNAWRIPASGERAWADYIHPIYLVLDDIISGAPANAKYLTDGADATLTSEVNIQALAAIIKFVTANAAITPIAVKAAAAQTAALFQVLDDADVLLSSITAAGDLKFELAARAVVWPLVKVLEGAAGALSIEKAGQTLAQITADGDLHTYGQRLLFNQDASGPVDEDFLLKVLGGDGAALLEWSQEFDTGLTRWAFWLDIAGVLATDPIWTFGHPTRLEDSSPALVLSGSDAINVIDVQVKVDANNKKVLVTAPSGQVSEVEFEDRILLDINDEVQIDGDVFFDANIAQKLVKKTGLAGDLRIGTENNGDLVLIVGGSDRWSIDSATGELSAIGGDKLIHNVRDPVAAQDAATKAYVDAITASAIQEITAASYTVLAGDGVILCNRATAGPFALTLPAGAAHTSKRLRVKDKKGDAGTVGNEITITPDGAETIDGAATKVINNNYGAVDLVFNGTEWSVL